MRTLDGPISIIGGTISGFIGWTIAFLLVLHAGAWTGVSLAEHHAADPQVLLFGCLLFAVYALGGHYAALLLVPLAFAAWVLPVYRDWGNRRLLVLVLVFAGAAGVALTLSHWVR